MMRASGFLAAMMAMAANAGSIFLPPGARVGGYHRFPRNSFLAARRQGRRRAHRNRRKAARS
jgi:hypothetical protein